MYKKCMILLLQIIFWTTGSIIDNQVDGYNRYERDGCRLSSDLVIEIKEYQKIVDTIVNEIINGRFKGDTHKSLQTMTDKFGARLTGGQNLEDSIDYMVEEFKKAGLENVHTEDALVSHWVRGHATAKMMLPEEMDIPVLALGYSVGTSGVIIGDVVAVDSFDELSKIPDEKVKGKIVVFAPNWETYGKTVKYRSRGAVEAAKKGAIASLIRSITPFSIGTLHTGMQTYADDVKKIPTACITVEDAERILRLYRSGERIQISLDIDSLNKDPVTSRNTIGELRGSGKNPNKSVVVLSGHLDSWDVGVGAMDDGGGAFISWKAVQYLKSLGLRPKRTLRSILWTGEEFGLLGAKAYQKAHKEHEYDEFNFFMESDIGTFNPVGLDFTGNNKSMCIFKEILHLMKSLNTTKFNSPIDGGPDISLWVSRGFPGASLLNENDKYFWYHHSAGDSMLLENSTSLDKCTALFAATAYVIADLSIDMPKD